MLVGRCRENNKYIFFLVRKNAQLGCQNDVLIVPLIAHFMCHNSKPFISRICFYGPELNHIHPVNQALCYTLDADHFFNDGTFSLATRSHEFTTTSKQQFLVDGNNVTVSFDIRRDFSSKISDAPVHLNSALTFEFDPSDNYTLHTVKKLMDKITWDDGVDLTAELFLCSRYAIPKEIGAEIKEKRELWKEILDGRMDESSIPEGESWLYLEDTAGSIEEATYRLKNMALLDYITECYKTKKRKSIKQ